MANSSQAPTGSSGAAGQASRTAEPSAGALTETHEAQTHSPILRLRGEHPSRGRGPRVQWAEGVVDNEGMGKKSSKVCCIYHPPKAVDESSDESDSSSSSSSSDDSDSDAGEGSSRRAADGDRVGKGGGASGHSHGRDCGHGHGRGRRRRDGGEPKRARKPSPNAYEKPPKPSKPKDGGSGGGGVGPVGAS